MSSPLKRKRTDPVVNRKGFQSKAIASTAEIVDYADSDEELNSKIQSTKAAKVVAPKAIKSTVTVENVSNSPDISKSPMGLKIAESNRENVFHYPTAKFVVNKRKDYFSETNMSHRDKLVAAFEDISEQEIEILQSYIQTYNSQNKNKVKLDILTTLKSILNESVTSLSSDCPADVEFIPEFKEDADRDAYNSLITTKAELEMQLQQVEYYATNLDDLGNKFDITTNLDNIRKYQTASSTSATTSSAKKKYESVVSDMNVVIQNMNKQCDDILNGYINTHVKNTLTVVKESQSVLFDAFNKVKNSKKPAPKSGGLLQSSTSTQGKQGITEVNDYVNLLQGQAVNKAVLPTMYNPVSSNSSQSSASATSSVPADAKKMLKGFSKI